MSRARFGQAGQVAITSGFSIDAGRTAFSDSGQTSLRVEVSPALHYFVDENLSIGGSVLLRYHEASIPLPDGSTADESAMAYGITASVGYNVRAADRVSIWPRLSLNVWTDKLSAATTANLSVNRNGNYVGYGDLRETAVTTQFYAPVLFHVASHFFLGFGPSISSDLWHSVRDLTNRRMYWGASSMLGGWF